MADRLGFKQCYRPVIVPSEGVFLLSERGHVLLRGNAYLRLAPLLAEGIHSEDGIVQQLAATLPMAEAYYALSLLRSKGYITESVLSIAPERAAWWELLGADPKTSEERIAQGCVTVVSVGGVDTALLHTMLVELGMNVREDGDLLVVLADDYLNPALEQINQDALQTGRPWLLARPTGIEPWIGPLFVPGRTGCWECLAHRLRERRRVEHYVQKKTGAAASYTGVSASLPSTLRTVLSMIATEAARSIACNGPGVLDGTIITQKLDTYELQKHILTRRPQCVRCGTRDRVNQPLVTQLHSQPGSRAADGGYRVVSATETVARLQHHISPITGIIDSLRPVASLGIGSLAPSYVTDHNFVHMSDDLYFMRESLRGRSGGKGKHDIQARASALGESIERYSGVYQGDEPAIHASYRSLGSAAIHPNALMLFSECQYAERDRWNTAGSRFNRVPDRFDEELEIDWSPIWNLHDATPRYLPTACCYYGYARHHGITFADADSNGSAAGNSKEEAILQGFMELVERDSVAIWWYNRLRRPAVNLESFNDPYLNELREYYRSIHRDLWVLDITSDLGIPSFAAVSRRNDKAVEDIIFGFGAHFDPSIALLRALTELNQSLPAVVRVSVDEPERYLYPDGEAVDWWKKATIINQPYLLPDDTGTTSMEDYPKQSNDDIYTDVMQCAAIVQSKGMELLVLDQTRPDTGLDVVKVIVPGLRHFWARFAPGRLYDVPVDMVWRSHPTAENELNPIPVFF